jgi:hypothetical protein
MDARRGGEALPRPRWLVSLIRPGRAFEPA